MAELLSDVQRNTTLMLEPLLNCIDAYKLLRQREE